MPQAGNIDLYDGQATPVQHTFIPLGPDPKDPTIFWFEDQSQTSPIGFWKLSLQLKRPGPATAGQNSSSRVFRVEAGLHQPVLETLSNSTVSGITPAPTIAYVPRAFISYVLPERSTALDRKNLRTMIYELSYAGTLVNMVENLSQVY